MTPRTHWRLLVVIFSISCACLSGCFSIADRLDVLEAKGHRAEMVREGQAWLDQADAATLASKDGNQVFKRVAVVRFQLAKQSRSIQALNSFRSQYRLGQGVDELVSEAQKIEATLYFNERTRPLDAVLAYRRFVDLYPEAREVEEVRRLERAAAFRDAKALGQIKALEDFIHVYGRAGDSDDALTKEAYALLATRVFLDETQRDDTVEAHRAFQARFPESKEYPLSKVREVELALEDVRGEHDLDLLREFRRFYASRPDAQDAIRQVYQWEAQFALDSAIEKRTADAFDTFRKDYPSPEWVGRADEAQMEVEFSPLKVAIENARDVPLFLMDRFLKRYRHHPKLGHLLRPLQGPLKIRIEGLKELWALRLYRAAFPDSVHAARFAAFERTEAVSRIKTSTDVKKLADFLYWYPGDVQADSVEARYYETRQSSQMHPWGWSTETSGASRMRGRQWSLDMTVKDCHGQSVKGLDRIDLQLTGPAGQYRLNDLSTQGDKSSLEYRLAFEARKKPIGPLSLTVRAPMYFWPIGPGPDGTSIGAIASPSKAKCVPLVVATRSKGVFSGSTCGGAWTSIGQAKNYTQVIDMTHRLLLLSESGELSAVQDGRMTTLAAPPEGLSQLIQHQSGLIGVGRGRAEHSLLWSRPDAATEWVPLPTPAEGMPSEALTVFSGIVEQRSAICMIWKRDTVACLPDGTENWTVRTSQGLDEMALKSRWWTFTINDVVTAAHWVDRQGRLFRSIDGGSHWSRVRLPKILSWSIQEMEQGPGSCLTTERGVYCSSTAGQSWSPLSPRTQRKPVQTIVWSHGLYGLLDGQMVQLQRIRDQAKRSIKKVGTDQFFEEFKSWVGLMKKDASLRLTVRMVPPRRKTKKNIRRMRKVAALMQDAFSKAGIPSEHILMDNSPEKARKTSRKLNGELVLTLSSPSTCPRPNIDSGG